MLNFCSDEFNQFYFLFDATFKKNQLKHNILNIHVQYFINKYCVFVVQKHFNNELVIYKLKCNNVYSIRSNKCQVVRQIP